MRMKLWEINSNKAKVPKMYRSRWSVIEEERHKKKEAKRQSYIVPKRKKGTESLRH